MAKASVFTILTGASFLFLVTFSVSVFAAVQSTAYVDSRNLFSINPPSGWTIDSSGAYGTAVILYGPNESSFRINMDVIVRFTSLSLSDYVAASKTQLSTGLTNYHLVSEKSTIIGGIAADELVNNFTQGAFSLKDQQDYLVQNGRAYIITSTAVQTDYSTYQPSFAESVQTFQVTTAPAPAFPWLGVTIVVIIVGLIVGVMAFFRRRMSRATASSPMPPPMNQPPPPPPRNPPSQS